MIRSAALLLLLGGCPYFGEERYTEKVRDADGDGAIAERFGGPDCVDDDPAITDCDADGDGFRTVAAGGDDCDDGDATVHPGAAEICGGRDEDCDGAVDDADPDLTGAPTWYADDDADGFGDEARPRAACAQPVGHVDQARDCDDARSDVHPGAPEYCDADERNCDGDPIADAVDKVALFPDDDGDGFAALDAVSSVLACAAGPGTSLAATDCDDADDTVFPGAVETWYDGVDQDCDGAPDDDQDRDGFEVARDCDDLDPERFAGAVELCNGVDDDCDGLVDDDDPSIDDPVRLRWYVDGDGDGFGDPDLSRSFCPAVVPSGYVLLGTDCDDRFASARPGGVEFCDDLDNDCNGAVDDNPLDPTTYFQDSDGDGHGTALAPVQACDADPGSGLASSNDDCNDADAATFPGANEICGDAIRQDCSALSAADCDGDGFDDAAFGGTDCDDTDPDVNPDAREICDGVDNDCDTRVDDQDPNVDLSTIADWYRDADGDGFGDPTDLVLPQACAPVPGAAANTSDCDDARDDVNPDAPERCDGRDNDCDGLVDDDDEDPVFEPPEYHLDQDGDGFGDPNIRFVQTCAPPTSGTWVLDGTDCVPADPDRNPFATEICNGVDDDCDTLVDLADPSALLVSWGFDDDGDGFGSALVQVSACSPPAGYVSNVLDCDDTTAAISPAAVESCNGGIDDDCDGLADDLDPDLGAATTWYRDLDGDGFGDPGDAVAQCGAPLGYVGNDQDCDDTTATVSPLATEVCGGMDDDCDGLVDEDDPSLFATLPLWPDADGDGFGDQSGLATLRCGVTPGWAASPTDCDDAVATTFPGASEICNGRDDDCDGLTDTTDPSLTGGLVRYRDIDGDGYGTDAPITLCTATIGYVSVSGDCDDSPTGGAVHPGAFELCNTIDDDCDGGADDLDPQGPVGGTTFWADGDGDGYGTGSGAISRCVRPPGYVPPGTVDCDDASAAAHPGAIEVCDSADNDCDTLTDEADPGLVSGLLAYTDLDGDGYGIAGSVPFPVCGFAPGRVTNGTDCNDGNAGVNPGAAEACNGGIDDDCDGAADDADPQGPTVGTQSFWADFDQDGVGNLSMSVQACAAPFLYVPGLGLSDCDDGDSQRYPGNTEVCDGRDNDCDPFVDALDPGVVGLISLWYDQDGDGYGNPAAPASACEPTPGYVTNSLDCDPADAGVHPGAVEICDGKDNDCDSLTPVDAGPGLIGIPVYFDTDGDGHGGPTGTQVCSVGPGMSLSSDDCDDTDGTLFPGQTIVLTPTSPFTTVQAAIDAVCAPATLTLLQGTVYDLGPSPLSFWGKEITLEGTDPLDPAVLISSAVNAVQVGVLDHPGLTLANLRIEGGNGGAAVWVDGSPLNLIDVEIALASNTAGDGGALRLTGQADVFCDGCRLEDNLAASGGGVYLDGAASLVMAGGSIAYNTATGPGSGLNSNGGAVLLVDTVFLDNGTSAGLELQGGTGTLLGVTILDEPGGARFSGVQADLDGVRVERSGRVQFFAPTAAVVDVHDLVVLEPIGSSAILAADPGLTLNLRNVAVLGGPGIGIDNTGATLLIENATIANTGGAGLDLFGGSWTLRGILFSGITGTNAVLNPLSVPGPVQYSLFTTAVEAGSAGTNNVSALDPLLQTAHPNLPLPLWDLHLRATSLARNRGPTGATWFDTDGTRNDIGYTGGPGGDNAFYVDSDLDTLWDGWERRFFGTLARDGTQDFDGDGLFDGDEFLEGTDPASLDTDGDGFPDGAEVFSYFTAPLDPLDP